MPEVIQRTATTIPTQTPLQTSTTPTAEPLETRTIRLRGFPAPSSAPTTKIPSTTDVLSLADILNINYVFRPTSWRPPVFKPDFLGAPVRSSAVLTDLQPTNDVRQQRAETATSQTNWPATSFWEKWSSHQPVHDMSNKITHNHYDLTVHSTNALQQATTIVPNATDDDTLMSATAQRPPNDILTDSWLLSVLGAARVDSNFTLTSGDRVSNSAGVGSIGYSVDTYYFIMFHFYMLMNMITKILHILCFDFYILIYILTGTFSIPHRWEGDQIDSTTESTSTTTSTVQPVTSRLSIQRPCEAACAQYRQLSQPKLDFHILGGEPVLIGEFPHMVKCSHYYFIDTRAARSCSRSAILRRSSSPTRRRSSAAISNTTAVRR